VDATGIEKDSEEIRVYVGENGSYHAFPWRYILRYSVTGTPVKTGGGRLPRNLMTTYSEGDPSALDGVVKGLVSSARRDAHTPVVLWVDGNPREVRKIEYDEDIDVVFIHAAREIGWRRRA
jgi:hypothetical protein